MLNLVKKVARHLFKGYQLVKIFRLDLYAEMVSSRPISPEYELRRLTVLDVEMSPSSKLSERAWYGGDNAYGFGLYEMGQLICMCWFWNDQRFEGKFESKQFLKIAATEAVMVDLVTLEASRGKGYAAILTKFAAIQLKADGFERLAAWVWHSNYPSIRTFEKAGWTCSAFVAYVPFFGGKRALRLAWKNFS